MTPLARQRERLLEGMSADHPLVLHFEEIEYYVKIRGGKIKHVLRNAHGLAAPHHPTHPVEQSPPSCQTWIAS